jgi:hypothetical protein
VRRQRNYDLAITATSLEPISTLRGAGVEVDACRAGRVAAGVCLAALAVSVIALFAAGVHKNAQITGLRTHGVQVQVTVTGCMGLLGGSGSNAAGYTCRGTYTMDSVRYDEVIPGDTLRPPGMTLRGVTVPGDPSLLSTIRIVDAEHASWSVFVLPAILLTLLILVAGTLLLRRVRISTV